MPVSGKADAFAVSADGSGGSVVALAATIEPADPKSSEQIVSRVENAFGQSLVSLRRWVEKGERWDA